MGKVHATHPGWKGLLITAAIFTHSLGEAAVESVSTHFVSTATVIAANGGTGSRVSFFGLPGVTAVSAAGKITATAAGSFQDVNANWTANQFNAPNGSFYVEFDSGLRLDISGTDGAGKTLTLANAAGVSLTSGSPYRIRRHLTVADVFGHNNEAGLVAGPNSAQADNILIHVPQTQQILTIFYSNVPGFVGWYFENYTPAGQWIIEPEMGVMVRNKNNRSMVLYFNGAAKEGPTLAAIYPGFNLVGTVKAQKSLTLSQLNLFTGDPNTGLGSGSNPASADNLILLNPDSTTSSYFYSDYPGFQGWYDVAFRASGNVVVAPGSAFFIQRKSPRAAFYWPIPAE